jgi:hypothetical protein
MLHLVLAPCAAVKLLEGFEASDFGAVCIPWA